MPEQTFYPSTKTKEMSIGMRQTEGINQARKDKHLYWKERIQIGKRLGRPARTIHREFGRGWVRHRTGKNTVQERYSADRG